MTHPADQPRATSLTLWRLFFPTRGTLFVAIAATLAAALTSTGLMALVSQVVAEPKGWSNGSTFLTLAILAFVCGFAAQYLTARVLERKVHELQIELMHRLLKLPLRAMEQIGIGRLSKALTADLRSVASIGRFTIDIATQLAIIIVCVCYLALTSWRLLLWGIPLGAMVLLFMMLPRVALDSMREVAKCEELLYGHFHDLVAGSKELKMHRRRRERWLVREVEDASSRRLSLTLKIYKLFISLNNMGLLLPLFLIGLLLFVVGPMGQFPRSVIVIFSFTILYLVQPIRTLASHAQAIQQARVALERITDLDIFSADSERLGEYEDSVADTQDHCDLLEAKGMTFVYPGVGGDPGFSVGPIDLAVHPGEVLFIVGGNGSGKSSMLKVLTGLYSPSDGYLLFNGEIIDDEKRDWFRQHVAAVFADFHLFENLHCDAEEEQRVRGYLERLKIDHKVSIEDGKLTTVRLSSGQRRRLALVTAFLHDRPVCVFDEWAADQDPEFKRYFYEEFLDELRAQGKAVIAITHDDRYFGVADRVIKLEEGRIVQSGEPLPSEVTNQRTMEEMLDEVVARLSRLNGDAAVTKLLGRARQQQSELEGWRSEPPSAERKYRVVADVMALIGEASRLS